MHAVGMTGTILLVLVNAVSRVSHEASTHTHTHTLSLSVALQYVERLVVVDVDFANTQLKNAS